MKSSLCIDARMWGFSGIGTYLKELIPRLEPFFDLILLVKREEREEVQQRCKATLIEMNSPIYTAGEQLELCFKIPPCDLFWSPHYNIPLFKIKALKRAVTIHDLCHLANPDFFGKIKRGLAYFLLSKALKRSDLILTVSLFSKREISLFFEENEKEISPVFCGAPSKVAVEDFSILEKLGIKKPFFLYVGNQKPHKNIERLIKAFKMLSEPSLSLVLVGGNSQEENLQIKAVGKLSEKELAVLYSQAKALVHPSLYEGFGLTPLEAMSYGCPVISSYFASLPEVCCKAALYVDPLSEESICNGMQIVLEQPRIREQLIEEGYKRVRLFSWDLAAEKLITLFKQEIHS